MVVWLVRASLSFFDTLSTDACNAEEARTSRPSRCRGGRLSLGLEAAVTILLTDSPLAVGGRLSTHAESIEVSAS